MKRSTVLTLRKIGIIDFLKKNKIFILMCIMFTAGCVASSIIYPENKNLQKIISDCFDNFLLHREGKKFFAVFINSFAERILFLFFVFLGGSSIFGAVLIPFIILVKGMYCGGFSALLYSDFALKGVAFNALIYIPPMIIFVLCLFYAAKESMGFSITLARISLPNCPPANISVEFKNYSGKFLLFLFVCLLSALVDASLSTSLLHFFNF